MPKLISQEEIEHLILAIEEGILLNVLVKQHIQSEEDIELLANIQQLLSSSSSFDFLKEEENHYTLADVKKIYTSESWISPLSSILSH